MKFEFNWPSNSEMFGNVDGRKTDTGHLSHTHYYNSNLIWRTVSCRVDEVIQEHMRYFASQVI